MIITSNCICICACFKLLPLCVTTHKSVCIIPNFSFPLQLLFIVLCPSNVCFIILLVLASFSCMQQHSCVFCYMLCCLKEGNGHKESHKINSQNQQLKVTQTTEKRCWLILKRLLVVTHFLEISRAHIRKKWNVL